MSETIERIKAYLKSEYGICSYDELLIAVEADKGVDVGIFTSKRDSGGKTIGKKI